MKRIQLLKNCLSKPHFINSAYDYLRLEDFITRQQQQIRKNVKKFAQEEIAPIINQYIDKAQFPQQLIPKLKLLNIYQHLLKPPYGKPISYPGIGILISQISKVDASIATFLLVQWALSIVTIQELGSEQQKQKYIPKLKNFEMISGWGLTEQKIGSDASNIQTTATKIFEGYRINGTKRWIGNGNKDIIIVWARNSQSKKIQGFILNMKQPGVTYNIIKHKVALRSVQNCHITINNAFVSQKDKLPKAIDFFKGTSVVLKHSRIFVSWVAAGLCLGIYDNVIKYASNRKQFGKFISSFQLVQQKISRIISNTQAVLLTCWRISTLAQQNKASMGQIALAKAFTTQRTRQIARLGRQILGGNGLLLDNYVMKALVDAQAVFIYQGTYDINSLLAGRQLTGISAFKN